MTSRTRGRLPLLSPPPLPLDDDELNQEETVHEEDGLIMPPAFAPWHPTQEEEEVEPMLTLDSPLPAPIEQPPRGEDESSTRTGRRTIYSHQGRKRPRDAVEVDSDGEIDNTHATLAALTRPIQGRFGKESATAIRKREEAAAAKQGGRKNARRASAAPAPPPPPPAAEANSEETGRSTRRNVQSDHLQHGSHDPDLEETTDQMHITSRTYLPEHKRKAVERWSVADTEKFFTLLGQYGTNFEVIATHFPGRTRREIKSKFVREDKADPAKITRALIPPKKRKPPIVAEDPFHLPLPPPS